MCSTQRLLTGQLSSQKTGDTTSPWHFTRLSRDFLRLYIMVLLLLLIRELADIYPLLEVEDMVRFKKPDWKCVFTYVQSFYRRSVICLPTQPSFIS